MRIKICGITTPVDAELVARLGADAVGLNFYAQSPRFIDRHQAAEVLGVLPAAVEPVGVMVSPVVQEVQDRCLAAGVATVQLHATNLDAALVELMVSHSMRLIVAAGVEDEGDLQAAAGRVAAWREQGVTVVGVLVDARVEGLHGGTGRTAPWSLLRGVDLGELGAPLYLAGGLTPENVAQAIRLVRPFAVDVASGVEGSPGRKDPDKLRRFIDNARSA